MTPAPVDCTVTGDPLAPSVMLPPEPLAERFKAPAVERLDAIVSALPSALTFMPPEAVQVPLPWTVRAPPLFDRESAVGTFL